MSVKVHEAYSLDSSQDRLLWWDDFLGDQVKDEWRGVGAGGSGVVIDQQTGGIVRLTTGATTANFYIFDWSSTRSLHVDQSVSMEIRAKLNATVQEEVTFALRFDGSNRILFYLREIGAGTTWKVRCVNGGAVTEGDTGTTPDTDYHIFRMEAFPAGAVHFFMDGGEVTNSPLTTNIPDDAADFLMPRLFVTTLEDVAKSIDIDYVVIRQEI